MRRITNRESRQRGIALIWAALTLFVIIGMVGLSLDWGKVALNVHQLHNAADAGALAGAQVVKFNQTEARVLAVAATGENYAEKLAVSVLDDPNNDPNGEVVLGRWIRQTREFIPTLVSPNAVKVVGNRSGQRDDAPALALLFGPIFHQPTAKAALVAIGWSRESTGSGIIVLAGNPNTLPKWNHPTGLLVDGGSTVDLRGVDPASGEPITGDIQVNSTATGNPWNAFRLNGGSADIYAGELNIVGGSNPSADDAGAWEGLYGGDVPFSVNPASAPVADPLAGITPPNIATMTKYGSVTTPISGTVTLNPGYYPGGINASGGTITLQPGVYAFGGGNQGKSGLVFNGGASLIGNGVMVYVTGDPTGAITGTKTPYGQIDMQGTGTFQLTSRGDAMSPPVINGELGVAVWQDRANTSYGTINGGAASFVKGVIYCPSNAMKITGTPNQMGSQLIVGALEVGGNISLGIAYDGRNMIKSYRSLLVY